MPGLPDAVADAVAAEALAWARKGCGEQIAVKELAGRVRDNETAVRLARLRLAGRARKDDRDQVARRALELVEKALRARNAAGTSGGGEHPCDRAAG